MAKTADQVAEQSYQRTLKNFSGNLEQFQRAFAEDSDGILICDRKDKNDKNKQTKNEV